MKKITLILTLLTLSFNTVSSQTVFGWETATDNGATITETIDGITVTLSGDPDLELYPGGDFGGTSGDVALTQNVITSLTFTFSQPVVVNSIIAIDGLGATNVDYTFTPTGGSNSPVTRTLTLGQAPPINLNWVNVTSFTVTSTGAKFGFDNLSIDTGTNGQTFFEWETANNTGGTITETVNGIGVTVSGDSSYALTDYGGALGTSGNVVLSNATRTSITFTFDQPVVVNSILAIEGTGANIDYTFTPTGGTNDPVTASLVSGVTAVSLNWIGVTSFTVTSSGAEFGFDNLSVTGLGSSILFDWDTNATQYYNEFGRSTYADETINGITTTVTSNDFDADGVALTTYIITRATDVGGNPIGTTGNSIERGGQNPGSAIVSFSEPVVVNSLLPYNYFGYFGEVDYAFIPTGGNNSPVTITIVTGINPTVDLNWVGVTSFTITPSANAYIGFDNLSVNSLVSLAVTDDYAFQKATVYPNPVENTLYIKNVSDLKFVRIYNLLGQQVLENKAAEIDVSELSKGLYLLQLITDQGMETKRIIKK
ncbi:T9SS type A sorting domain-containing protein [Mariniflexile sp. HMF6888]|uniref:T9SS type A sorting domain-containing protein n=1 Tax=Mariniflexile sp. HMF6888 TaxID=3373086 RepID=UPI00378F3D32